MTTLKFSKATDQAKLRHVESWLGYKPNIYSFSLPSGYTCPFAFDCLSKADKVTGKISDSKNTLYRCFSASDESRYPSVRKQRWHNFDLLKHLETEVMYYLIKNSLPAKMDICRIHVGGDFFNQKYFDAWVLIARNHPHIKFYAYTKSIPYWVHRLDKGFLSGIPSNLILNASRGSRYDNLIDEYDLKVAEVVFSIEEATEKNLPIDHNEYYALNNYGNFALLLHGTQPKNSQASEALKQLRKNNIQSGYNRSRVVYSSELIK